MSSLIIVVSSLQPADDLLEGPVGVLHQMRGKVWVIDQMYKYSIVVPAKWRIIQVPGYENEI